MAREESKHFGHKNWITTALSHKHSSLHLSAHKHAREVGQEVFRKFLTQSHLPTRSALAFGANAIVVTTTYETLTPIHPSWLFSHHPPPFNNGLDLPQLRGGRVPKASFIPHPLPTALGMQQKPPDTLERIHT